MPARIKLTLTGGVLNGREFVFGDRTVCTVGRGCDCHLRLPSEGEYQTVSRHHCVFDIDPPFIRVRDADSLNGTCVNGIKIGQRGAPQGSEEITELLRLGRSLHEGDVVQVGDVAFQVHICEVGIREDGEEGSSAQRVEQPGLDVRQQS